MGGVKEKHRRFVDEFLTHGNATAAAEAAGYAAGRARRTGSDLLRRPDVAEAIRQGQEERAERLGVEADQVVREALEIVAQARQGTPKVHRGEVVTLDGEPVFDPQLSAAVSALSLVTRVLGFGAPQRVEHEHAGEVVYTLHIPRPHADEPPAIETRGWDA